MPERNSDYRLWRSDAASAAALASPYSGSPSENTERIRRILAGESRDDTRYAEDEPPYSPPPAPPAPRQPQEPAGVDLAFIIACGLHNRRLILASTVALGLLGAAMTFGLSKNYTSSISLYFDPQQVAANFLKDDKTLAPEVLNATIESQLQIITSSAVLEKVVKELGLSADPSFAGTSLGQGDAATRAAINTLAQSIKAARENGTYVISLNVKTGDPALSANIANAIVAAYTDNEQANATRSLGNASDGVASRVDELRQSVIAAEAQARDFRAKNELYTVAGDFIADKRMLSLDEQLVAAQRNAIAAKTQLDAISRLNADTILVSNAGQDSAMSRTLSDLRAQYAELSGSISSLAQQLGPRHPKLLAAKASLRDIQSSITAELARVLASARSNYQAAQEQVSELTKRIGVEKANQAVISPKLIELSELERKAKAVRDIYETVLQHSEQTATEKGLYENRFRVIAPATQPIKADGPGTKILMVAGAFGGALAGFCLSVLFATAAVLLSRQNTKRRSDDQWDEADYPPAHADRY